MTAREIMIGVVVLVAAALLFMALKAKSAVTTTGAAASGSTIPTTFEQTQAALKQYFPSIYNAEGTKYTYADVSGNPLDTSKDSTTGLYDGLLHGR
jgi:tRNA A37 threonylcarbamoyladenosine synthetase subunit TsaC/SUA5/YrdC